jgi:hypothetical protein
MHCLPKLTKAWFLLQKISPKLFIYVANIVFQLLKNHMNKFKCIASVLQELQEICF